MALQPTHELHGRRFGRNLGVGLLLAGFVALVFALTVVKVQQGDRMHANDFKDGAVTPVDTASTP